MGQQRPSRVGQPQPSPIGEAYTTFLVALQAKNVTRRTLQTYHDRLGKFISWCSGRDVATVEAIAPATVRAYLIHLQDRKLSPWTVHGAARAVRAFFYFCEEDGLIAKVPRFKMPKMPKKTLPAFEYADVERPLDACLRPRDREMFDSCSTQANGRRK